MRRRIIHENGVTHNVYGDPNGLDRPWNLDLIPLLIPSAEWQTRPRRIDPAGQTAGPPAGGSVWPDGHDFERAASARNWFGPMPAFCVPVMERAASESLAASVRRRSGAHPRRAIRSAERPHAGAFRRRLFAGESDRAVAVDARDLSASATYSAWLPSFVSLRDTLSSLGARNRENPRIVLLTPGPYNETYFEHSYLAQYLGYSLVQGNDLTVRDETVYMKTVGGLQRVDVILRRVDDDFCDPLELVRGFLSRRAGTAAIGSPGQRRRGQCSGRRSSAGSRISSVPSRVVPVPARRGIETASVPTWWCGQPAELKFVLEHLHEMVIKSAYPTQGEDPVFGQNSHANNLPRWRETIKARPERYVAQNPVMSCTTPALIDNQVQPRRFVVRSYLAASGDSYAVMDGGLTRITPSNESLGGLLATWRRQQGHLDSVGRSGQPDDAPPVRQPAHSLQPRRQRSAEPHRRRPLLAGTLRRTHRSAGASRARRLSANLEESGVEDVRAAEVSAAAQSPLPSNRMTRRPRIHRIRARKEGRRRNRGHRHPGSRSGENSAGKASGRRWRNLQETYQAVLNRSIDSDRTRAFWTHLSSIVTALAAFTGLTADSMMRSQSWRFLDMGRRIERALFVAGLLSDTLVNPGNDPVLLEAILEITESSFPYRRKYLTHLETHAVRSSARRGEQSALGRFPIGDHRAASRGTAARRRLSRPRSRSATARGTAHLDSDCESRGNVRGCRTGGTRVSRHSCRRSSTKLRNSPTPSRICISLTPPCRGRWATTRSRIREIPRHALDAI